MLEGPTDILIEKSLHFAFKTSNNQAKYEAILVGLSLAREVGIKSLTCTTDSKLTVGHLNDEFQIKDPTLLQYYHLVCAVIDDKRQPWPNADKKSGPQLLTGPKLLSFGPTLFKY